MADTESMFVAHRDRLFRYLCRAVGHEETARDLTQDVFVRVARHPVTPATDDEARAWLFSIARNLALDYHRRQRRECPVPPDSSRSATQDASAVLNQALGALPAVDRDVFLMREIGGLSYSEIAAACGLTPDAVRSRIHRARVQLREWLSAPIAERRRSPLRQQSSSHE